MTAGMIVGLLLLPFAWMLMAAANKAHRDETGVDGPTRDAWRRIRRNARNKGISEAEAYNQWLNRKTRKSSDHSMAYDFSYPNEATFTREEVQAYLAVIQRR